LPCPLMSKADICRRPHAFRDSPQIGLAVHIGAQLPLLVQGLHYDQWRPSEQNLAASRISSARELQGAAQRADVLYMAQALWVAFKADR